MIISRTLDDKSLGFRLLLGQVFSEMANGVDGPLDSVEYHDEMLREAAWHLDYMPPALFRPHSREPVVGHYVTFTFRACDTIKYVPAIALNEVDLAFLRLLIS